MSLFHVRQQDDNAYTKSLDATQRCCEKGRLRDTQGGSRELGVDDFDLGGLRVKGDHI